MLIRGDEPCLYGIVRKSLSPLAGRPFLSSSDPERQRAEHNGVVAQGARQQNVFPGDSVEGRSFSNFIPTLSHEATINHPRLCVRGMIIVIMS